MLNRFAGRASVMVNDGRVGMRNSIGPRPAAEIFANATTGVPSCGAAAIITVYRLYGER